MGRLNSLFLVIFTNCQLLHISSTTAAFINISHTPLKSSVYDKFQSFRFPRKVETAKPKTHIWTNWELCPDGLFVSGMSLSLGAVDLLKKRQRFKRDTLKGIKLACGSGTQEEFQTLSVSKNASTSYGPYRKCSEGGLAVGYQLKQAANFSTTPRGIIDFILYCNDWDKLSKVKDSNDNVMIQPAWWIEPKVCAWGQYLCGIRTKFSGEAMDKMTNVQMKCCTLFDIGSGWRNYREVPGKVIESKSPDVKTPSTAEGDRVYDHHFKDILDYPFYYKWTFCPITTYVTGMQLQFGARDIRLLCSDMTMPTPRISEPIQMDDGSSSAWEEDEDNLSNEAICEGVAIGVQVKYDEELGIQAVRLFCSYSVAKDKLSFVEARFRPLGNSSHSATWQEPQLCGRQQTICGFKALTGKIGKDKDELQHFKAKCCQIPEIAEICFPGDKYELLVECDATEAYAETTCTYTQSEGVSVQNTKAETEKRDQQFHDSLAQEWSINDARTNRENQGAVKGITNTASSGSASSNTLSNNQGRLTMVSKGNSSSESQTGTQSDSTAKSDGYSNTTNQGKSSDHLVGGSESNNTGNNVGTSSSQLTGNTSGSSESGSSTISDGKSTGSSESDTEGTSIGFMDARMVGASNSRTDGSTDSKSDSSTDGSSSSSSISEKSSISVTAGGSVTVKAEGRIPFLGGGGLEKNFHISGTVSGETGSDSSDSRQQSRTRDHSSQRNSQQSSDQSKQDTSQKSGDQSNSKTTSQNQDVRSDQTKSEGSETNRQTSNQNSQDRSSQQSRNHEIGSSFQNTHRVNSEDSKQSNAQLTSDKSNSTTKQQSLEASSSLQNSLTSDISNSNTTSSNTEESLSTSSQITLDITSELSNSKSRSQNSNRGTSFTTGFDWTKTSSHTWNMERSHTISMVVPAGIRAQLYQVVGYCAHYRVKTSKYRRVDHKLRDNGNQDDKPVIEDDVVEVKGI